MSSWFDEVQTPYTAPTEQSLDSSIIDEMPDIPDDAADEQYATADGGLLEPKKRGQKAMKYEKSMRGVFNVSIKAAASHEATVPDAAALLVHGPQLAEKLGDLAAADARVARMVDFLTDGTENPYAAVMVAAAPLILQVFRNHEPVLEPEVRGIRIPFLKRTIKFRFGIKLGRLRAVTNDPAALSEFVFTNPDIAKKLAEQGINVATGKRKR